MISTSRRFALGTFALLFLGQPSQAQNVFWERVDSVSRFDWSLAFGSKGVLYASDGKSGVYASSDDGLHWKASNTGLHHKAVSALYSSGSDLILAGTEAGVYRSTDGAATWTPASTESPTGWITCIARGNGSDVLAACEAGLLRSTDAGASWNVAGPPSIVKCTHVVTLRGGIILLSTRDSLFRSENTGVTWQPVLHSWPPGIYPPCIDTAGTIFVVTVGKDLRVSTDQGLSWSSSSLGALEFSMLAAAPDGSLYAYQRWREGLFRSKDRGAAWTLVPRTGGTALSDVTCLEFDPDGRLILGDYDEGLFRIPPDSAAWQQLRGKSLDYYWFIQYMAKLAINDAGTVALRTVQDELLYSNDGGSSWILHPKQFFGSWGNPVLKGGRSDAFLTYTVDSVFISDDGAVSWRSLAPPDGPPHAVLQTRSGAILLGGSTGVFRSADGGRTFFPAPASSGIHSVMQIEQDPQGTIYSLVDSCTLLVSDDDGLSWTLLASAGLSGFYEKLACGTAGRLYLNRANQNLVYWSNDGGATFQSSVAGTAKRGLGSIGTDLRGRVFTGSWMGWDGGIWMSVDGGSSWQQQNSGFYSKKFQHAFQPGVLDFERASDGRMYVLTDSGLYRAADWTLGVREKRSVPLVTGVNYPNPFRPSTTITWTLEARQHTELRVYDHLGRSVALLADADFEAGTHQAVFHAGALPAGVYFACIRAGERTGLVRMVLLGP